jgi:hypothetical protein
MSGTEITLRSDIESSALLDELCLLKMYFEIDPSVVYCTGCLFQSGLLANFLRAHHGDTGSLQEGFGIV